MVSSFLGTAALAAPQVSETLQTYAVDATTAKGLRQQMKERGPKGYWAYTRWDIRWTGGCRVTVKVAYTMPKHKNPSALSPDMRRRFDAMLANLMAHEKQHGQHGIDAAHEIYRANCNGGMDIIRKYNRMDEAYDRRTKHGQTEGVVLN